MIEVTEGLYDQIVPLARAASHYEDICRLSLGQDERAHDRRRALEQRLFTLLNLSRWVRGQW